MSPLYLVSSEFDRNWTSKICRLKKSSVCSTSAKPQMVLDISRSLRKRSTCRDNMPHPRSKAQQMCFLSRGSHHTRFWCNSAPDPANTSPDDCGCSVTQPCPTLCNPMHCSMPGFPILHYLLEFAQTHVLRVGNPIQPSCPLSPPSPSTHNLSQHQSLSQWTGSLHKVAKVLELQLQHQSFQWIVRVSFLKDGLVWSPCSPRDFQDSSPTPRFESVNSSALSLLYGPTHICIWLPKTP